MGWKFWEKAKPAPAPAETLEWATDSYGAVKMLAHMFLANVRPFGEWEAPDAGLVPGTEKVAEVGSKALVLALFFWRFALTHGDVATRIARDGFLEYLGGPGDEQGLATQVGWLLDLMDEGRRGFEEMPEEKRTVVVNGETVQGNFHWYLSMLLLVRLPTSPCFEKDDVGNRDFPVAMCLAYASERSQLIYEPMLAHIGPFNPASYKVWQWSAHPGAHERHLQRRHNNPLFTEDRRHVTVSEVYYARLRDVQAIEEVRRGLVEVHEELKKGDLPYPWHPYLNGLREQIDELTDRVLSAGGDAHLEKAAASMRANILEVWRIALGADAEGIASLDKAEAGHNEHRAVRTPWTQQVTSAAKPIPEEEVTCSLLCESVEDIEKAVAYLGANSEAMTSFRGVALRTVMEALAQGHEVPQHRQKLAAMGVSI